MDMSSLDLANRSLGVIIIEASVCLAMSIISITGNILVCLAVYRNPKLRSTTNVYIVALAASDLLCATVEMSLASATLIIGRRHFGDALCEFLGFVDAFVTYVTPATMGLTAFNRYMRIVKTNNYNKIFSPRKSKIWLSCVWLFLAFYLLVGRVINWSTFQFDPGYAVCSIGFAKTESRIVHYCVVFGLFFSKTVCGILEFHLSFQITGSNVRSIGQKFILKLQIAFILFWKLISKIPHTVLEVNVC